MTTVFYACTERRNHEFSGINILIPRIKLTFALVPSRFHAIKSFALSQFTLVRANLVLDEEGSG